MMQYGRHLVEEDDVAAVVAALKGDLLTGGPYVEAFETRLAEIVSVPHAVSCANGTAALHLAALAIGLGPGDVVVVPSVTFVATANAVRLVGAEVVFADVDPQTGLMTVETMLDAAERTERSSLGRVSAVFPVHLNGQCVDMPAIAAVARERGWKIVEDAAHAVGSAYGADGRSKMAGCSEHADAVCFSFHPVKTIAMGEGGAVTTRDAGIAERLRLLRNHGLVRDPGSFTDTARAFDGAGRPNSWYYELPEPGLNYRASDLHSALGHSQLAKLDRFVARRRLLVERYETALSHLAPFVTPIEKLAHGQPAWHLSAVLIDFARLGRERAAVMAALRAEGIGTQVHYIPVHSQPYYRERYGGQVLPGAESYYQRQLSLPLFVGMEDGDVDHVVSALARVLGIGGMERRHG